MINPPLAGILFSKDRAMQLDLTLKSFILNCTDFVELPLVIIYQTKDERHARQYETLKAEFSAYPSIRFHRQTHFWKDVIGYLGDQAGIDTAQIPFRSSLSLGPKAGILRRSLMRGLPRRYLLFLVDDNIFIRAFSFQAAVNALEATPRALGLSLRLGTNTTYCYTAGRSQQLPRFAEVGGSVLSFDWTESEEDFGYPLEVSSSIYRIADLLPWLHRESFQDPNELETRLAEHAAYFQERSEFLCFRELAVFCNPANRVNRRYQNRAGETFPASNELLADKFDAGFRVDAAAYSGFLSSACHQEVAFEFLPPVSGASTQLPAIVRGEGH